MTDQVNANTCPILAATHTPESLEVLAQAFPEARYWDFRMGVMHTIPDCMSSELHDVYMYMNENKTPLEARGPCARFGGVCSPRTVKQDRIIHQFGAFAPKIPELVYTDINEYTRVYHLDAFCSGLDALRLLCTSTEQSLDRGNLPCPRCNPFKLYLRPYKK